MTRAYTDLKSIPNATSRPSFSRVGLSGVLASDAAVRYRPPANPPAHGHHEASSAMVGPLAPVLVDPAAKLRELQDERVVKETLIGQIGGKRDKGIVKGGDEIGVLPRRQCSGSRGCRSRPSEPRTPAFPTSVARAPATALNA